MGGMGHGSRVIVCFVKTNEGRLQLRCMDPNSTSERNSQAVLVEQQGRSKQSFGDGALPLQ
jgi:hypothetical protein